MSKKDDDRAAYEERAAGIRRQVAEGKRIEQVMAEQHAAKQRALLEKALEQDREDRS